MEVQGSKPRGRIEIQGRGEIASLAGIADSVITHGVPLRSVLGDPGLTFSSRIAFSSPDLPAKYG